MRKPEYLSPSAIDLWIKDRREYYVKYLADVRSPKIPQTDAMALGSAFDSFIKAHITLVLAPGYVPRGPVLVRPVAIAQPPGGMTGRMNHDLVLEDGSKCPDVLRDQYLSSVEPHNDRTALRDGWIVYQDYLRSGSLARLLTLLPAGSIVKMESTVRGTVDGVPLSGKPDLYCLWTDYEKRTLDGTEVEVPVPKSLLLDWKVNGFYSKTGAYPNPGAFSIYDSSSGGYIGSGSRYGRPFEECDATWARQVLTYAWCLGLPNPTFYIDQLAYRGGKKLVATVRGTIEQAFAEGLRATYVDAWSRIERDHIFSDMTVEESRALSRQLDTQGNAFVGSGPNDDYFRKVAR